MNEYLEWRRAVKVFDPSRKLMAEDINGLKEVLRLSPSSFGLQPWRFMIVEDPQVRQRLRTHAWDQPQVTEASHLIVLCVPLTMEEEQLHRWVLRLSAERGLGLDVLAPYEEKMRRFVLAMTAIERLAWMKRQVYIALGTLLTECAHRHIDACPLEGFVPAGVDEVLGLGARGLSPVVMCALGYRSTDDPYCSLKKVRLSSEEVFI